MVFKMKACSVHGCRWFVATTLTGWLALSGCSEKQTELGQGGSEISGSAGPQGARNAAGSLEQCAAPIATVALVENPRGYVMPYGNGQLPPTPVPLIKLLAQQSGCFRVVDRNAGLQGTIREGELRDSGVLRQNGNTANMIFPVDYLISYISSFMTLEPGDIIATGTPAGCGLGQRPQVWLQPGQVMELSGTGLGSQRQEVHSGDI